MKNIAEYDKNFTVKTNLEREGLQFLDAEEAPFKIFGIFKENGKFRRLPEQVAKNVNKGVFGWHTTTAGGRVRFVTDSPYVAIKSKQTSWKASHCALTGLAGYDMYAEYDRENRYIGTFVPPFTIEDEYEGVLDFNERKERIITINFPLYSHVEKLWIGLQEGCVLDEAPDYKIRKPIVYYGSSITQGGCASKPGSSYPSILERRFHCDYVNLGFSGSAKAEDTMIDYIKNLDMSIFVFDYDHNAPDTEYLAATHSKMFEKIRAAHPDLPILILPRPKYHLDADDEKRREIIENTYLNAKAKGDENVYYISGRKLMEMVGDNGTVDNIHPTDSGFFSMAIAISEVFEEIFRKQISQALSGTVKY